MSHDAGSARADQDPHRDPTTATQRGRTAHRAGEGRPPGTRQDPRERDGTRGHRGGGPVIELECGVTVYPARGWGPVAGGLV